MVRLGFLAARRQAAIPAVLAVLAAMAAVSISCGTAPATGVPVDGTPTQPSGPGVPGEPTLAEDDFVAGEGSAEGFIYINPARSAGVGPRQTKNNFILSATKDESGIVPSSGTQIMVSGTSVAGELDADGHYSLAGLAAHVATLAVTETTADGAIVSEAFEGVVIVPGHTTRGSEPPSGVTIAISPSSGALEAGGLLELSATLRDGSGAIDGFRDFRWLSGSPGVATAQGDATGTCRVRGLGEGTAAISAAAGALEGSINVSVNGSVAQATAPMRVSVALSADGPDTRVNTFDVTGPDGGSIAISDGGSASFIISSPDGSTRVVNARGNGTVVRPESAPILSGPVSGTGLPASITLRTSGGGLVLTDSNGGSLTISNRLQISFPVTAPGVGVVPSSILMDLPMTGPFSAARVDLPGLPDGSTATVMVALGAGGIVSASGTASGGALLISGFPEAVAAGDITDVVLSISAPPA